MPDLVRERIQKLFHPQSATGGPAAIGDVWTFDSTTRDGQWKTPLTAGVTLPLSQANGGTGASSLPLEDGPGTTGITGNLLKTDGTVTAPTAEANSAIGTGATNNLVLVRSGGLPGLISSYSCGGTLASPSATVIGNHIFRIAASGWTDAGSWSAAPRAAMSFIATNNYSATAQGSRIDFITTPINGTTTAVAMQLELGLQIGSPTGGDKGSGTLNATSVYANNVLLTSDERLKSEIEPTPKGCLALVRAIVPKMFRHRGAERRNWGFLAQDVNRAMVVNRHEFGGHVTDAQGNQSLGTSDLVACLWQAVRELSEEVAVLKAQRAR